MGGDNFMTPKAISNRIKARGLQKLRYYCQMCRKQMRDENGFKCHCLSESHIRQMQVFRENPDKFMDEFSDEFESTFLSILKRKGKNQRIKANSIYQEMVADRTHVHMNSTKWTSLTQFLMYLGKNQIVIVEHPQDFVDQSSTSKTTQDYMNAQGWFITYIDRDSDVVKQKLKQINQQKLSEIENKLEMQNIQKQIQYQNEVKNQYKFNNDSNNSSASSVISSSSTNSSIKFESNGPIKFGFKSSSNSIANSTQLTLKPRAQLELTSFADDDDDTDNLFETSTSNSTSSSSNKRKHSSITSTTTNDDETSTTSTQLIPTHNSSTTDPELDEALAKRARIIAAGLQSSNNSSPQQQPNSINSISSSTITSTPSIQSLSEPQQWISVGLVVKIMNRTISNGDYYKVKADIILIDQPFIATIKTHGIPVIMKIDETELETVIPSCNSSIRIVSGKYYFKYKNRKCILESIDQDNYSCSVKVLHNQTSGEPEIILHGIPYEHVCKPSG